MANHLYSNIGIIGAFLISLFLSYLITPFFRLMAIKLNFLDHPQTKKKSHVKPIPLLGGLAIIFSFVVSVMLTTRFERLLLPLFLGTLVLLTFGLVDDKLGMMPRVKLTGQLIAALIIIRMGIKVDTIPYYYLSLVFTLLWIIGITNAFNLLDNLNGLSSGIAGISALFFGIIAWTNGQMFVATLSFALAGSCFGFIKHNFPRANIFMGDAGSMFLGFMLACIALLGCWETKRISVSLSVPILILAYPIFDTALVTIIRIFERRSIFQGGRDHSSHILSILRFVRNRNKAVVIIFVICVVNGIFAWVMSTSEIYVGFGIMVLAYTILFWIFISLLFVRFSISRSNKNKAVFLIFLIWLCLNLFGYMTPISNIYVGISMIIMIHSAFLVLVISLIFARKIKFLLTIFLTWACLNFFAYLINAPKTYARISAGIMFYTAFLTLVISLIFYRFSKPRKKKLSHGKNNFKNNKG